MRKMRNKERDVYTRSFRLQILWAILIAALAFATVSAEAQIEPRLKEIIFRKADKHGIDRRLLLAIAITESGGNPFAVGNLDDRGLFQLRKKYFGERASFDPRVNADAAAAFLSWLSGRAACRKHGRAWFVCYNRGVTGASRLDVAHDDPYVMKVEAVRRQLEGGGKT